MTSGKEKGERGRRREGREREERPRPSNFSKQGNHTSHLSVLKRFVPKTLAFAFGLRLRSKTRCFKTRVLGRKLPNGKPQERLRFRDLRSITLSVQKHIAIVLCDLKTPLGARACVQVFRVQKTRCFAFAFLSPLSLPSPLSAENSRIYLVRLCLAT